MADALQSRKSLSYKELLEEKTETEAKEVILFDSSKSSLEEWFDKNKPSKCSREDGIGWLAIESPNLHLEDLPDIEGVQKAWEELVKTNKQITFNTIRDLAIGYDDTRGKWLFHVETGDEVDEAWKLIAFNIINGELGNFCNYAKVSPHTSRFDDKVHVITIYNGNFTNKEAVITIAEELRKIGIRHDLLYKPNIYTHLKIFPKNQWNIIPTIYVSTYDVLKKKFEIQEKPFKFSKKLFVRRSYPAKSNPKKLETDVEFCAENLGKLNIL